MTNEIAIAGNQGFMIINNLDEAQKVAKTFLDAGICQKGDNIATIVIKLQKGFEVGLLPTQSVNDIAVINGRPVIWGDAALGLCKIKPDYEYCNEWFDEKVQVAYCEIKRKGETAQLRSFSMAEATKAGLSSRDMYTKYTRRMLQMRARGFALRDVFPHHLRGLHLYEEYAQLEEKDLTPHITQNPREENNKATDTATLIKAKMKKAKSKKEENEEEEVVLNPPVDSMETITQDTHGELFKLIEKLDINPDRVRLWCTRANIKDLKELPQESAQRLIDHLQKEGLSKNI